MRPQSVGLGPLTVDEYLRLEESLSRRHEFVAGRMYEMSGTTVRHNQIVMNILKRLDALRSGTTCRAYCIDLKVRATADKVYYPDALLVCAPHQPDTVMFDAPCFIVEVTSPSTRRTDRGEKLDAYLGLASLRGYLIVEHDRRHATLYERRGDAWTRDEVVTSGRVRVACVDGELSLDDVYADVELPSRVREGDDAWYADEALDEESFADSLM